jgi:pimeloyl-ACP methyl ester carboxylesterase
MTEDMSMEGLAACVRFILDKEGITQCTLIGHSMGGYITLAFAEKYPQMLHGFGLFHSTAFADTDEKIASRKKGIAFMQEHGGFEFLKTAVPKLYSDVTKQNNPSLVEEQIQSLQGFSKEALIAYYEAMIRRPDRTEVLKQNKQPVLFVLGKYDSAVPAQETLKQVHLPQKTHVHILEESGHMGMQEEPEKSCTLLLDYLSGIEKENPT